MAFAWIGMARNPRGEGFGYEDSADEVERGFSGDGYEIERRWRTDAALTVFQIAHREQVRALGRGGALPTPHGRVCSRAWAFAKGSVCACTCMCFV
eukprot:132513-Pleurochrysis_carterae.AAC.1